MTMVWDIAEGIVLGAFLLFVVIPIVVVSVVGILHRLDEAIMGPGKPRELKQRQFWTMIPQTHLCPNKHFLRDIKNDRFCETCGAAVISNPISEKRELRTSALLN
jgi:hypothetical protein